MNIFIVPLIVLIIVIYCFAVWNTRAYNNYMTGLWVADDEFCELSDVDSIDMMIGPYESNAGGAASKSATIRTGYISIAPNLTNQVFKLTYQNGISSGWAPIGSHVYTIAAKVEFEEEQLWTDTVYVTVDILKSRIIIKGTDDVIYASLIKSTLE